MSFNKCGKTTRTPAKEREPETEMDLELTSDGETVASPGEVESDFLTDTEVDLVAGGSGAVMSTPARKKVYANSSFIKKTCA